QAEDGIRDFHVTGVQTCALPICTHLDASMATVRRRRAGSLTTMESARQKANPLLRNSPGPSPDLPTDLVNASRRVKSSTAPSPGRVSSHPRRSSPIADPFLVSVG